MDKVYTLTTIPPGTSSDKLAAWVFTNEQIPLVWEQIEPFIEKSVEASQGTITTRMIYDMLCEGSAVAIGTADGTEIKLVTVLRRIEYANYSAARIIAMAGTGLREAHRFIEAVEAWAISLDCVELEGWCRPAVTKLLRRLGWKPKFTIVTRDLRRKLQ